MVMTGLRVLLVDDELLNREIGRAMLARMGHAVRVAASGDEAIVVCRDEPMDLVLLDVQMPGVDGVVTGERIRSGETGTARVRIVALTGATMPGDRERCLAAGMDAHLTKPLRRNVLARTIDELFGMGGPVRPPEGNAPLAPVAIVDVEAILAQVHGDMALLRTLIAIFREQSARLLADGRRALGRRDSLALDGAAHALKSVVGHFSTGEVFRHASEVEAMARTGHVDLDDRWRTLEREVDRVRSALDVLDPGGNGG